MKQKKGRNRLEKLLNKVKKKIEASVSLDKPVNGSELKSDISRIIMNFYDVGNYNFADKLIHRVKPLLDVKIRNKLNTNACSICGNLLDDSSLFPKDFPNQFRMCCHCMWTAEYVYNWDHPVKSLGFTKEQFKENYKEYQEEFDNLFIIKRPKIEIKNISRDCGMNEI